MMQLIHPPIHPPCIAVNFHNFLYALNEQILDWDRWKPVLMYSVLNRSVEQTDWLGVEIMKHHSSWQVLKYDFMAAMTTCDKICIEDYFHFWYNYSRKLARFWCQLHEIVIKVERINMCNWSWRLQDSACWWDKLATTCCLCSSFQ